MSGFLRQCVSSRVHISIIVLLAVAALILAACGQESVTPTPTGAATTLPSITPTAAATPVAVATATSPASPATPGLASTIAEAAAASPTGPANATNATNDHTADAQAFVSLLAAGNYEAAQATLDITMTQLGPGILQQSWESLIQEYGQFKQQLSATSSRKVQNGVPYQAVVVTCAFEKANVGIQVTYGPDGKVAGFHLVSEQRAGPTPTFDPPKVDTSTFTEKEVTVGSGEWTLPGTLTMPNGDGPFPALVLVHGSGPNDRDETIGPNKPFRDMAWGLASRGVAVLRYDKRTRVYPARVLQLKNLTYKDETIDDSAAAVSLLSSSDKVDPRRVFVLGHSLGGYLLPRIAEAAPQAAGLVSLAGATRPLEDIILDQYTYIASLDGTVSAGEQKQLDELKQQVARVKDPALSLDTPSSELPLGIPASEWLDVRGYDPAQMAKGLKQPMLILQGENDYQVTMQDFQGWKDALSSRSNVTFKSYPKLDHLFMTVEGKITPAAYTLPGHVLDQVIEDIAGWIKGQ